MLKLMEKADYVINGDMLDCYLDLGLKLENITSKVGVYKQKLEYSKSEWLKLYIDFNIKKRKEAKEGVICSLICSSNY